MSDFTPPPPVPSAGMPVPPPLNQWSQPVQPPAPAQSPMLVRPLRGIATAVRWLIAASALSSFFVIAVEAMGVLAIDRFLDGSAGIEALESYDALSTPTTLLSSALLLATGICWVVWQHRAASSVSPDALRRSPGWHVGSWFIPVVAWWFPVQNISDLIRASRAAVSSGAVAAWWTLWVAGNLAYMIVNRLAFGADSLPQLSAAAIISIIGEALTIGAAVFAWLIVARITDALDPAAR